MPPWLSERLRSLQKSLGYAIFGVKSLIQPTNLLFTAKAATAAP